MATKILKSADSAYQYPLLIKQLLTSAQRFETENAIVSGEYRFSYAQFNERVHRLANTLKAAGIGEGDTVAVMDWDSHRYLECFFAVPMIGAILHTVNIRLSPSQIEYTMNHAQDDLVLVHDDFLPIIDDIRGELKTVKNYIRLTDVAGSTDDAFECMGEYEALLAEAESHYDFPDFDENSVATAFYTTGTTGNPKGVYFSHRQLVLHTLNMVNTLNTRSNEGALLKHDGAYMPITPMFHVHAWGIPYAATMMGVKQVYPLRYEPNTLARLIREEGVTFSHCVPTVLQMVIQSSEAANTNFDGWKVIIGGSALTPGLAAQALELGIEPFSAYGMSETCPLMAMTRFTAADRELPTEEQLSHRTRAGLPSDLVDIAIWDPAGNPLPHDGKSSGEVVVRAPWLTQSYLHEPEKGDELWQGGWLHTGDVAAILPNGTVEIRDRIKDVIKTGGEWISSLDLERLISQHPGVDTVAVIGVPDERWGERPFAMIVPKSQDFDVASVATHLQQYVDSGAINKWAIPREIELVNDIPKTSVGKIDKKLIRAQVAEQAAN
ncbi:long-chain-fatty-acid--CoA ligase [Marinobacterium nitratireducens]|uniref:Long-chain-fatty-acid--CoA ligase n=1 Tax=Marinobacterium nitratireducens TaxID=518897 RepID=A0A917ZAL8_9GAMM|nr:fatty acid--CoA ligase [Marinobacterium nitratireducens]GGO78982.1 long-chain-fatty-acid--CoA ligase [Marinobacterium nitratireducens]